MPVTLADMRTRVSKVLKRHNVTTSELDEWINDGVRRIQRNLVTPLNSAVSTYTVQPNFNGLIKVPGNLLNLYSVQCNGHVLPMRAITEVKQGQKITSSNATMFAEENGNYLISPLPRPGSVITISYRADAEGTVSGPTDSLRLFDVAADLVLYAALIRAADWSIDGNRLTIWNSMYNALFIELQDMAYRDDYSNAAVGTPYNTNGDWNPY